MRSLIGAGLIMMTVVAMTVSTAPAAEACSCVPSDIETLVDTAAAVFVGRAVDRTEIGYVEGDRPDGPNNAIIWTFDVETVLAGDVPELVQVGSGYGGGDCGFDFDGAGRIGVAAHRDGQWLGTGICGGVWDAVELLAAHGPGYPPTPVAGVPPPPTAEAPLWWWVGGVGTVLLALGGLVLFVRRKRTHYQDGWPGNQA